MATYFDRITGLAEQEWQAANACTDVTKKDEYLFRAAKYGHIDALFAFAAECVGTRAAQVSEKELKNIYKKISKFSDKLKKAKSSEDAFAIADKCLSWDDKAAPRYQYILGKKVAQFGKFSLTMLNAATAGDPEAMLAVQEQASTNDNIADFYTGRILYAGKFDWDQMLEYAFCGMGFDYSPYYPKGFADIPGMPGGVDIPSIRANAYEQLLKTLEFFAVPAKQGTEEYKARFGDFVPDEDTVMIARYWFYTKDARLTENSEITAYKGKVVAEIDKAIKLERLKAIGSAMEAEDKKKAAETKTVQSAFGTVTVPAKAVTTAPEAETISTNPKAEYRRMETKNGDVYEGEVVDGKYHGKGTYTSHLGFTYVGDFLNNTMTGKAHLTGPDGTVYEGDFLNGKRNGKGKVTSPEGWTYEGDWAEDKKTGKGKFTYKNGDTYEGDLVDGVREGQGLYVYASGNTYEGQWKDDIKHGHGIETKYSHGFHADYQVDEGEWIDGKKEGRFVWYLSFPDAKPGYQPPKHLNYYKNGECVVHLAPYDENAQTYEQILRLKQQKEEDESRAFEEKKRREAAEKVPTVNCSYYTVMKKPVWISIDPSKIAFSSSDGNQSGWGFYNATDGGEYIGTFKNGKLNGFGQYHFANGGWYTGEFSNNLFHGVGIYFDGVNYHFGNFENGLCATERHFIEKLGNSYDVKTQDGLTLYIKTSTMLGIETDRVFMGENAYSEKAWECTFDKSSLSVIMGKSANGVNDPNGVFLFGSPDNNGEAILYRGNIVDSAPSGRMTLKYVNGNTCEVIINGSDVKTISETDWAGRKVK